MIARYLRVKDWPKHQHYRDRRPPWIKLYVELISDTESAFAELSELEQWQLVRVWLRVSLSDITVPSTDPEYPGRDVPVIAYDEPRIRLAIKTLKRIPLAKFVKLGLLEELTGDEVDELRASTKALAPDASKGASTESRWERPDARKPPLNARAGATEGLEVSEQPPISQVSPSLDTTDLDIEDLGRGIEQRIALAEATLSPGELLLAALDDMDDDSPGVVRALIDELPPYAPLAVKHWVDHPPVTIRNRTGYAIRLLQRMLEPSSRQGWKLHKLGRALERERAAA